MQMFSVKEESGFSLVELLLVVVILGIVGSIAIPNILSSRQASQQAAAFATLRTMLGGQQVYRATKGRYARLVELNAEFGGSLGTLAGPTLRRQGYVFQMIPTSPTNAQLANQFTTAASGYGIGGRLIIFTIDERGTLTQVSP